MFVISDIDLFQDDSEDNVDDGKNFVSSFNECVSCLVSVVWDSRSVRVLGFLVVSRGNMHLNNEAVTLVESYTK